MNGTHACITGYIGTNTSVTISEHVDGWVVQETQGTLKNNTSITEVAFPSTLETTGDETFCGCTLHHSIRR